MTRQTHNVSSKIQPWKFALLGAVFSVAGAVALSGPSESHSGKSERIDPTIEERIKQARGLQKMGNWTAAADLFTALADEGHPVALYHLGRLYKNGWGVEPDPERARAIFLEAISYRFAYRGETAYELGRLFQRSSGEKCAAIALQWFLKALDWDYTKAHVQLAKHYERGIGTERDLNLAFHHYEQAAIAGYPSSTINYARILLVGRYGLTPAPEKARFWAGRAMSGLEQKARDGSASSAKTLGRIYRDGEFVEVNAERARDWFMRSANLGDAGAMHDLAQMLLAEPATDEDVDEALQWLRLAGNAEHGGALTALARLHLKERYGLQAKGAVTLLERGVEAGHPGAMQELGRLYAEGLHVAQDSAKALELAAKGANRGHQGSARLLKQLQEMDKANLTVPKRLDVTNQDAKEG